MELQDIIRWVDIVNANLNNAIYNLKCGVNDWECWEGNDVAEDIALDNEEYPSVIASKIIYLDNINKRILFRRLFRESPHFFSRCVEKRDKEPFFHNWIADIIFGRYRKDNNEQTRFIATLESAIFDFYKEMIHLCYECELNPMEFIIPQAKDVVDDIIKYIDMPFTEKLEIQRLSPLTNWQDFIIGNDKTKWESLIANEIPKANNRNGRLVATIIKAMEENGAIIQLVERALFYRCLRKAFPNLNTDTSINNPLNGNSNPISKNEVNMVLKRLENY